MIHIDDRGSLFSFRAVIIENQALRVVVLPELGGRIWSIVYKPRDRELLWHNPDIPPQKAPFGAAFDNAWCGGWEEMLPTAAPGTINGRQYPDHGEIWCLPWDSMVERRDNRALLTLRCRTPNSEVEVEKHIILSDDEPAFDVEYSLKNSTSSDLPFLFALHPAFSVSPSCRLDMPPMTVDLDPTYLGTLTDSETPFQWPNVRRRDQFVDLSTVFPPSSEEVLFLYGHDFPEGWFAITDIADRISWGLRFPAEFFRSCWVFASYGGWQNYHTLHVEPSTSHPQQIEDAIQLGRAPVLAPHGWLKTRVRFQIQEGLSRVNGLRPRGEFVE